MKKLILRAISILLSVVILPVIWWKLVMYKGFPIKPPKLVRMLVIADGEIAYDLLLLDMCLIVIIGVIITCSIVRYARKRRDPENVVNP